MQATSISFLKKIINGSIDIIDSPELLNLVTFKVPSYNSRSYYPFHIPICTINYSSNQSAIRIMLIRQSGPVVQFLMMLLFLYYID